jgi:hypothetical protein
VHTQEELHKIKISVFVRLYRQTTPAIMIADKSLNWKNIFPALPFNADNFAVSTV